MKAKDFLRQPKKIDLMIKNKLFEKEQWKSIALGTTASSDRERVQSSGDKQKMAGAVERYIDIENEIDCFVDRLVASKKEIIEVIEKLNDVEYDLLHKVYIQYISLDEYACIYGKTYSWATTVHGRALKNVQRILDRRERGKT